MRLQQIKPGDWVITPLGMTARVVSKTYDGRVDLVYLTNSLPAADLGREVLLDAKLLKPWKPGD